MGMQWDRLTTKAQEALQEAQNLAAKHRQQELSPEHFLLALLEQEEGLTSAILEKIGIPIASIQDSLKKEIAKVPLVVGSFPFQNPFFSYCPQIEPLIERLQF